MKRRTPRIEDVPPVRIVALVDPQVSTTLKRLAAARGISLSLLVSDLLEREAEAAGHGG